MKTRIIYLLLATFGPASLVPLPAIADGTVTYTGVGTFVAMRSTLPLANGGAAFHLSNDVVATIEPSDSGVLYGDCAGLGYADADGVYSARAFCTFSESEEDAFAIEASVDPGVGGKVKVIGGSGKWAGATGDGTLVSKDAEGYGGSYQYEFRITTP